MDRHLTGVTIHYKESDSQKCSAVSTGKRTVRSTEQRARSSRPQKDVEILRFIHSPCKGLVQYSLVFHGAGEIYTANFFELFFFFFSSLEKDIF